MTTLSRNGVFEAHRDEESVRTAGQSHSKYGGEQGAWLQSDMGLRGFGPGGVRFGRKNRGVSSLASQAPVGAPPPPSAPN